MRRLASTGGPALVAAIVSLSCGRFGYELLPADGASGPGGASADAGTGGAGSLEDARSDAPAGGRNGAGGSSSGGRSGSGGEPADAAARDGAPDATEPPRCPIPTQNVADYCASLPELVAPPTIDGDVDCGLALHALSPKGWTGGATSPDVSVEYVVAWRPDGLYFYVSVTDPLIVPAEEGTGLWTGDGVELFADSDGTYAVPDLYDRNGTRQFVTAAPPGLASVARGQVWANPLPEDGGLPAEWRSTRFRAFPRAGGYVVEAFVLGADLGIASVVFGAGDHVGMDVGVDVSYPDAVTTGASGHRLGQFFLSVDRATPDGGVDAPFLDTGAFCNPVLVAR